MTTKYKHKSRATYGVENYVCPKCFYPLEECECDIFPPYYLLMIDKEMQKIIRILNRKGYKTIGCCESHYGTDSSNINIIFGNKITVDIPDGFVLIKNGSGIAHYYDMNIDLSGWELEKKKYLNILVNWAENLPRLDNRG